MPTFKDIFSPRLILLTFAMVGFAATLLAVLFLQVSGPVAVLPFLIFGGLTLLGIRDMTQTRHAILRNYLNNISVGDGA